MRVGWEVPGKQGQGVYDVRQLVKEVWWWRELES